MGYDNIMFLSPHTLSFKDNCLVVDGRKERALEDINTIIFENRELSISAYLLSEFSKYDITCIFCDEKHMPCCLLLPVTDNVRHRNRLHMQMELKLTVKKDLWKKIVSKKILNQARCLAFFNPLFADRLVYMSKLVKTNDNTNMESEASMVYFPALFGKGFVRREDNVVNSALNYGYAIIRSIIARSLVAYGFEPSLGLCHCNMYNSFNLADDFIEPFRAMVDKEVKDMLEENCLFDVLTTQNKQRLIALQNSYVLCDGNRMETREAINKMIMSYIKCCETNTSNIILPDYYNE